MMAVRMWACLPLSAQAVRAESARLFEKALIIERRFRAVAPLGFSMTYVNSAGQGFWNIGRPRK
jgi:hypothetical protein